VEDDQNCKELPIWMQSMIQWMVDGSSDEILPTTTDRKAGMGQEYIHSLRGNGLT
jgi:hypothetical protein